MFETEEDNSVNEVGRLDRDRISHICDVHICGVQDHSSNTIQQ